MTVIVSAKTGFPEHYYTQLMQRNAEQKENKQKRAFILLFLNETATTEIYTLSLHDALPFWCDDADLTFCPVGKLIFPGGLAAAGRLLQFQRVDRKSTRLNSSHSQISYAVFCLKKKKF